MYKAFYRKYRPSKFSDVVGQKEIIQTLLNSLKNNNISHAYLFTGPRGTGKTSVAKILAKSINCNNRIDGEPCNKCVNCVQATHNNCIDIIEIDAASNNGVDEIRELKSKINLVPSLGKYKVYIIDEVHMLTIGAFNALLKTLEEPPTHAIFILATTEPHKIPQTILSRCQRFDFKRISSDDIKDRIYNICKEEKIEIDKQAAYEIAALSDGGLRDALVLLEQASSYADGNIKLEDIHMVNGTLSTKDISRFVIQIANKDMNLILKTIDYLEESGKNYSKILEKIIDFLKNLLIYLENTKYILTKYNGEDYYSEVSQTIDSQTTIKYIDIINNNLLLIKNSNNQKLTFEIIILKMINITNKISVKDNKIENIKSHKKIKDSIDTTNIEEIQKIRINNTLAKFDKKELLELKKKNAEFNTYLIDQRYSKFASIIIDGELKAASQTHLIYVYKTESDALVFNSNLDIIEELIEKIYNKKYVAIATDNISWEIIKKEFNSHNKKYELQEEPKKLINNTNVINEIDSLFFNKIEFK